MSDEVDILDASCWTQPEAIALCRAIETVCVDSGCHVALTGGCLYKWHSRKDLDILFYRIRQTPTIDLEKLFSALKSIGIERKSGYGWVYKLSLMGRTIDAFFPEESKVINAPEAINNPKGTSGEQEGENT